MRNPQGPAKILVVDDVPRNVRLLELNLKSEGYQVIPAYNGQEALDKVSSEKPDLILLDIMMPGMDGYEVCRRLRQRESTRALPIVMVTAYEKEPEKKIEAIDIGADDFIRKPFERYELLARVKSLLRVKYLYDELKRVNQRLEDELIMAREVQLAFLPQEYPDSTELNFAHKYIPTFAVGGDFFDIRPLSGGLVEIFISDVMGHGPQAAMITGVIKTLLTSLSSSLASPGYLLSQINQQFHRLMDSGDLGVFVTAFSMVIDTRRKKIIYSNAGHPRPFLIQRSNDEFYEMQSEQSVALGMIPNTIYQDHENELKNGDMLFLFTDGLLELMNRESKQFHAEELNKAISNNTHLEPEPFVEAIMCAAEAFAEGLTNPDDMTLLAIGYKE
ncbi:SpoIIE family protein phosphatase [Candidatus Poribacteria bacterium]|nr:SpoIIE family protein phosphatase [Candidatus Poribacteria bacterium]